MGRDATIQVQVDYIKTLLRRGDTRSIIMGKFGAKWRKPSKNTFDRRMSMARDQLAKENKNVQKKAEEKVSEKVNGLELEILTVLERKSILAQIAKGGIPLTKPMVCNGEIVQADVIPTYTDRMNAIAELNKMDGDYAPTKTDLTSKGKQLNTAPIIIDWTTASNAAQADSNTADT